MKELYDTVPVELLVKDWLEESFIREDAAIWTDPLEEERFWFEMNRDRLINEE